jgi:hypothetical protein
MRYEGQKNPKEISSKVVKKERTKENCCYENSENTTHFKAQDNMIQLPRPDVRI